MKGNGVRRSFTLSGGGGPSFIDYQSLHWKVTVTGARFDPQAKDELQDPARTPMEWMRDNNVTLTKEAGFDEDVATAACATQLGPYWEGFAAATGYVQATGVTGALRGLASSAPRVPRQNRPPGR